MKTVSKLVAFTLALAIIFTLPVPTLATENPFDDVSEGAWYYDDVMLVVSAHVMEGTDAVHFAPDATLTRAMMATILWRLAGAPEGNPCAFTDVENGSWYYQAVAWAQTTGIVSGIGNNQFAPNNSVTREQMAAMVYNFAARQYSLRSYLPTTTCELTHFTDASRISTYAVEPVRWLVSWNGLHCEGNALQPRQNATRAEVAASVAVFLRETNTPANYTGKSAYELAVENGYTGSVQEWLASLVGPAGKSAYELAVDHGYQGTEEAWLNSLSGKSAYEIALDHGFEGTEAEWLDSLHGDDGTSVVNAQVDASYHLIITLSDGTEIDAGYVGAGGSSGSNPPVTYTVRFVDYDGTVLKTQQVEAGGSAEPPADPVRAGYTFSYWAGSYTNVQSNVTITAVYTKDDVYYTVTFVDYDGTVLKTEQVLEGSNATPPADPAREGYTFTGWSGSYTNVHANTTVTATYEQNSAASYTVTFYDYDGTTVLAVRTGIPADGYAEPPADPTKIGATFMGWGGTYANVNADSSARAVFSDEKNVLKASSVSGSIGNTVTVLITLDGQVKACAFDINIMYDPDLELLSYDDDLDLSVVTNTDLYENGILLNWSDSKDKTKERDVIELTFRIKNTTKQALPIELTVNSIKEVCGQNIIDTAYSIVTGIVHVN